MKKYYVIKKYLMLILFSILCCYIVNFVASNICLNFTKTKAGTDASPSITEANFCLRSRFVTNFDGSGAGRVHNIKTAVKQFENLYVNPNEQISFNATTGHRDIESGYQLARIILNGEYIQGVGGGVCQVSTTLYNALLLADIEILEAHRHSIKANYVYPSFDAMVTNGDCDLKFRNQHNQKILIKGCVKNNDIIFEIFGTPLNCKIERELEIIKIIQPESPKIIKDINGEYQDKVIFSQEKYVLRRSKLGYYSKGYIIKKIGDVIVEKKFIREDYYLPLQEIVVYGTL